MAHRPGNAWRITRRDLATLFSVHVDTLTKKLPDGLEAAVVHRGPRGEPMAFDVRLAMRWRFAINNVLNAMVLDDLKAGARRGMPALAQLSAASLLAAIKPNPTTKRKERQMTTKASNLPMHRLPGLIVHTRRPNSTGQPTTRARSAVVPPTSTARTPPPSSQSVDEEIAGHGLVAPSPTEAALASHTLAWLTSMVVRVPKFTLRWFRPQGFNEELLRDLHGRTFPNRQPPVVIILAGMPKPEVVRVLVHECQHVRDAAFARAGQLTKGQLEQRARDFESMWTPPLLEKLGIVPASAPPQQAPPEQRMALPLSAPHSVLRARGSWN